MKNKNLISVLHSEIALESISDGQRYNILKKQEINCLQLFCNIMKQYDWSANDFDGYYVGYKIEQIGKEFDLLRFGKENIINIEFKSKLNDFSQKEKYDKILEQMKKNYYYLKFLTNNIEIFTYIEEDGFYKYNCISDCVINTAADYVTTKIKNQEVDYEFDPDKRFIPSNYLISPFNSTDKFINTEYFLTLAQQDIKKEILNNWKSKSNTYFCISAGAGTGKTLLLYDIAKELQSEDKHVKIVHCGKLNEGHLKLNSKYNWHISPIKNITNDTIDMLDDCDYILVDEAQRIWENQLRMLIAKSTEKHIPMLFNYDTRQYLRSGETCDICEFIKINYKEIYCTKKTLTNKIRTNKNMASFIKNMFNLGASKDNSSYECVSIDFFNSFGDLRKYISFQKDAGWKVISYSTSQYNHEPYNRFKLVSTTSAHDVIGQEFSKVLVIMDENFNYDESGKLLTTPSYYSARGMLYQMVTRVVDELKIVVLNNPELYVKLLELKNKEAFI